MTGAGEGPARMGSPIPGSLLDDLLVKTSRTFALSIPVLPEPVRRQVTVAYLLFRIADTLEDATRWPGARKDVELELLGEILRLPRPGAARSRAAAWRRDPPLAHAGYLELLDRLPDVLAALEALGEPARGIVIEHIERTIQGMRGFARREGGDGLALGSLAELRDYCYVVAGIVGEMLTSLFVSGFEVLAPVAPDLQRDAATFGEALQLVNILKDSAADAREGRSYLPSGVRRSEVLALARRDLTAASGYCERLHRARAPRGLVEFTTLPVLLAFATLEALERLGAGAKIGRAEVYAIVQRMHASLDRDEPGAVLAAAAAGRLLDSAPGGTDRR